MNVVCVHMYICTYVHMYIHTYMYISIHVYTHFWYIFDTFLQTVSPDRVSLGPLASFIKRPAWPRWPRLDLCRIGPCSGHGPIAKINATSDFGPISDQSRFWGFYVIFIEFDILGWIRSGHDIQNIFVNCEFQFFFWKISV